MSHGSGLTFLIDFHNLRRAPQIRAQRTSAGAPAGLRRRTAAAGRLGPRGVLEVRGMEVQVCPCCHSRGLVLTVSRAHGQMAVSGLCRVCGYAQNSDYAAAEAADDLRCDYENEAPEGLASLA